MAQDTVFQAAYLLEWHNLIGANVASKDHRNEIEMMNSTEVITCDKPLPSSFFYFSSYCFSLMD